MNADRIVRIRELKSLTGLSTTTIWRKEKDNTFPKRRRISKRAVGWSFNEILQWIEDQQNETGKNINV